MSLDFSAVPRLPDGRTAAEHIEDVASHSQVVRVPMGNGGMMMWHVFGAAAHKPILLLFHGGSGSWIHWIRNVLPLSEHDPQELRGQRLMLLGYPTGLAALLARADPEVTSAALAESRDPTTLIEALSRRHAITPVITHGTLSEVSSRQLIYDAVTTAGGSGGPVFDPDGEVIGVNFATLRDFQGSNYGVPVRFVRALLR